MSETTNGHGDLPPGDDEQGESRAPRRVIGTPPPAEARTMLAQPEDAAGKSPERWLPDGVPDTPRAKSAERVVAALFVLSMLASIGFIAAYVGLQMGSVDGTLRSNLALGLSMSIAFLALAVGAVIWVRWLMPKADLVEERKPMASKPEDRAQFAEAFTQGTDASGFVKRPLLRRTLIAATVPLAVAPIVLLRDLGPLPRKVLRYTAWVPGRRLLVYGPNTPIRPADFATPGQMITVVPAGSQDDDDALAKAATIIIKMPPEKLQPPTVMNWTVDNIVAYSKICTHVGCPVALYEETTHRILCPCHQSTFDATRGAKVIFGPAPRSLPQLPLGVDSEGYLIATSDFHVPVGPAFWELGGSGFRGGNE
jgi:ubiquinol-cytochrome c reductase iron-sulfur subunit